MKTLLSNLVIMAVSATFAVAGEWGTDWEAAKAQAQKEKKPILINFTGTDWCGWCIRLDKEVFSKEDFKKYAKEHLVLMEVDFPRKKEQSAELKAQNKKLDKEYKVEGYPTIYLLDSKGEKISGDIGYREGGAAEYVKHLKSLLKDKEI